MAAFNPEGFSRLPAAQKGQKDNPWRFLEETQPVKLYGANQLIYLQEETAERFYYLKSGRVRIFLSSVGAPKRHWPSLRPEVFWGKPPFSAEAHGFLRPKPLKNPRSFP